MLTDKKLTKAADNLYTEPYEDGKDFKWFRELQSLHMEVYDVQPFSASAVTDPRFPLGEEYKEQRLHYLRGIGVFDGRSIHLIDEEGAIGPGIDQAEFSIREYVPTEDDKEKDVPRGSMWWQDEDAVRWEGRRDPYLIMELHVSSEMFNGIAHDINEKSYDTINLSVYAEVFQSEVERSLAEPWMHQDYCIEAKAMAATYFHTFTVRNKSVSPHGKSLPKDDIDDWEDEEEWDEPQKESEPIEEIRDLFTAYATTIATHAKGIKVALYWILFVLIIINIPW